VEIPDSNGVTCGIASELAQYVVDQQFCEESVSTIGSECCVPAAHSLSPTAAPSTSALTAAPSTTVPTADPDESSGTTNVLLAPFAMTFGPIFYLAFW
jgi:hypothetical protein